MGRGNVRARARVGKWSSRPKVVAALAALLFTGSNVMAARPANAEPSTSPTPAAAAAREDAAALRTAQQTGEPTEIVGRRTETTELFREPSGQYLLVQHIEPVRVRRGDDWVDVDPTLVPQPDGSLRPKALPVDMTFSYGRPGPFASLREGTARVALTWPYGELQKPELDYNTAIYKEVLPGVDLEVTAGVSGFSEVFVVKTPTAAKNSKLAALKLGFETEGVAVTTDSASNTMTARDATGTVVFRSATPMMWGNAATAAASGKSARARSTTAAPAPGPPAPGATTPAPSTPAPTLPAPMKLHIGADELTVLPGAALRSAPADAFPINIDPDITVGHGGNWTTTVSGSYQNSKFWGTGLPASDNASKGNVKVGRVPGMNVIAQSYFRLATAPVNSKIVDKAEFQIAATHAWNCASRPAMQLALTGAISPDTTWKRRPTWQANRARNPKSAPCPTGAYKYDVSDLVQLAAEANWSNLTVGLRAQNENSEQHWRRFRADRGGPTVKIWYHEVPPPPVNRAPHAPANLTTPSATFCGTATNPARVGAGDLRFTARLSDPDGDTVNGFLDMWGANTHSPIAPQSGTVASGTTVTWTVPGENLQDDVVYAYAARAVDSKRAWGPWNPRCYLVQDTTGPGSPTVKSEDYPADADRFFGSVGKTGSFTFTTNGEPDAAYFLYGTQDPPTTRADMNSPGSAQVDITPVTPGPNTLHVRAVDSSGNRGPIRHYSFNVDSGSAPQGWWRFDEGAGAVTADRSGGNHPVTLANGTWTRPRAGDSGTSYHLDGTSTYGAATGPVVDTSKSYTISAWANPYNATAAKGFQAVVASAGANRSPVSIGVNSDTHAWELRLSGSDAAGGTDPGAKAIVSPTQNPAVWYQNSGVWHHLAASYDAGAGVVRFYVDGVLVGATPYTAAWKATEPFQIGRSRIEGGWGNHFPGLIDDVRVWDRVVLPDEIQAIASDGQTSKVQASAVSPGKPCLPSETADRAVDASVTDNSKWCTHDANGRSLQLALATETTVRSVAIRHAGAGGESHDLNTKDFDIETSVNGRDWVNVGRYRGNKKPVTVLALPNPIRASFVRLVIQTPAQNTDTAARIYEVEVYGSAWKLTNVANGTLALSDSPSCTPDQTADKVTDGVVTLASGWCTGTPAAVDVDLGEERDIRWIVLRNAEAGGGTPSQNTRHYNLEVSTDGATWTTAGYMRDNNLPTSGQAFSKVVTARYVRVSVTDASVLLPEVEVYAAS